MAKTYIYRFTATGRGNFPVDMLRYDRCWPRHEPESGLIIQSIRPARGDSAAEWTVELEGLSEPTEARWESFGWSVANVTKL